VSQTTPDESQGSWQQPPFAATNDPNQVPVVSGHVVVPGEAPPAPSVLESTLNVVNGVIWPIAIFLGILGIGSFIGNIFMAVIASIVLGQITKELRRRRRPAELGGPPSDLR